MILAPELFLLSVICLYLILDLFLSVDYKKYLYIGVQFSLLVCMYLCAWALKIEGTNFKEVIGQHYLVDDFSQTLKMVFLVLVFVLRVYSQKYLSKQALKLPLALMEYQVLILFCTGLYGSEFGQ